MLVGLGLSSAVALPRILVSDGIIVAPLRKKQHPGQGCEIQMSWNRGASSIGQLRRLLLVLLGPGKFVITAASGKERSSAAL